MAKIIKVTEDMIAEMREDFELAIAHDKMKDGKFEFKKSFNDIERKATVYFEESAYLKMQALISTFDKEVAWNGLAKRIDGEDSFLIYDILVYPQKVTGTTVNVDAEKEFAWKDALPDEVFNNIRFQGHSHVNMGTSPSGTDNKQYEDILSQIKDDMFYIFMIWNKKGSYWTKIYDLRENVLFEDNDCEVKVLQDEDGIMSFIEEAKGMVSEEKPAVSYYKKDDTKKKKTFKKKGAKDEDDDLEFWRRYKGYSGYSGYNGYSGYSNWD